jgi:hypothetical protein
MAVNYVTAVKNARLDAVAAAINTSGTGSLVLLTAGNAELVRVLVEATINPATGGVLTVISTPKQGTATAAGTATLAKIVNGADADVATGLTVGTTAGNDVQLNDNVLIIGSQVTINSGTITTP